MSNPTFPILVIGRTGQLATSLQKMAEGQDHVIALGRPEVDFDEIDPNHPENWLTRFSNQADRYKPCLIINAAAWTQVDLAETEPEKARRGNHLGPALIAIYAAKKDIPFLHLSTDYVFDGTKGQPYKESDPVHPVTIYGETKAEGEKAVLAAHKKSSIFRTAWVYSPYGRNFVRTMLAVGAKNPHLRVVGDQKGNPTSAEDLASCLLSIARLIQYHGWKEQYHGIFHATGQGEASWYDLACATLQEAEKYGQKKPVIESIKTQDWPTPAKRPADSRLDNHELAQVFGQTLPFWQETLARTVQTIFKQDQP